jgi:hypothetical protein
VPSIRMPSSMDAMANVRITVLLNNPVRCRKRLFGREVEFNGGRIIGRFDANPARFYLAHHVQVASTYPAGRVRSAVPTHNSTPAAFGA